MEERRYITPREMGMGEDRRKNICNLCDEMGSFLFNKCGMRTPKKPPTEYRCYCFCSNFHYNKDGIVSLQPNIQEGICPNPAVLGVLVIQLSENSSLIKQIEDKFPMLEQIGEGLHAPSMRGVVKVNDNSPQE
ncbi:MAG: hypothetical protein ABIG37_02730 [Nanoarchaeota archaeon]|nr:hypothetical protein [Nanoarchaeota archaeon]